METVEERLRAYLKSKGLRFTAERRTILREIMALHDHFEPEVFVFALRGKGLNVSRASVYRTLPLLVEAGIVHKTSFDVLGARYEHIFGHEHHDHMVCVRCGEIIEFTNDEIESLQKEVAEKYEFEMVGHRLVIRGLCGKCRGEEGPCQ